MNLFVFGTLKKGFPLHAPTLDGAVYLGDYRTVLPYRMLIAGPWFAPMLRAGMRLRDWLRPLVSLADHVAREHAVGFDPGGRDLAGPVQSQRPLDSP